MENHFRYLLTMDSKEFRKIFGEVAKSYGFRNAYGGWYKESDECISLFWLQKSSYANEFYLNLRAYIQGAFNRHYFINKEIMKSSFGHVMDQITGNSIFDLEDIAMSDEERIALLRTVFEERIIPFTERCLSKLGIIEMFQKGDIYLLPAVREELGV